MNQNVSILNATRGFVDRCLHFLFPKHCYGCKESDKPEATSNFCVFCWNRFFQPKRAIFQDRPDCMIFTAGIYDQTLKEMLIQAKFKHHRLCIQILIEFLHKTFQTIPHPIDYITSIPSYYDRSLWRGVDLPGMLAVEISKRTGIPYQKHLLSKKWSFKRQMKLSRTQRKKNVRKMFTAHPDIAGKNVLVIDDILTTGSTVLSCYQSMRKQKPHSVIFLVVAKT